MLPGPESLSLISARSRRNGVINACLVRAKDQRCIVNVGPIFSGRSGFFAEPIWATRLPNRAGGRCGRRIALVGLLRSDGSRGFDVGKSPVQYFFSILVFGEEPVLAVHNDSQ